MALSLHARMGSSIMMKGTRPSGRTRSVKVHAASPSFLGQSVLPPRPSAIPAPGRRRPGLVPPPRHAAATTTTASPLRHRHRAATAMRAAVASRGVRGMSVEANLFSRLVRVVKAYVSNFTEQFEDPEVLLDRVTDEMQEDLIKMRQATAKVMASEKQMATKFAAAQNTAYEWLRRAELAVRKGQDELAREALLRRKTYDQAAASLKIQLDAQRRALEQLQANVRVLEGKLGEARNKRETLKARAASAKSSKQIQEMVAGLRINNSSAWAAFDKMEEKVMAMEAEAESVGLLAAPDTIEAAFARLEGGTVEDELQALKRGQLAAPRANGSGNNSNRELGRPLNEVLVGSREVVRQLEGIDAELEQLRKRARAGQ